MGTEVIKTGLLGQSLRLRALSDEESMWNVPLFPAGGFHPAEGPRFGWGCPVGGRTDRGGAAGVCIPCTAAALPPSPEALGLLGVGAMMYLVRRPGPPKSSRLSDIR